MKMKERFRKKNQSVFELNFFGVKVVVLAKILKSGVLFTRFVSTGWSPC